MRVTTSKHKCNFRTASKYNWSYANRPLNSYGRKASLRKSAIARKRLSRLRKAWSMVQAKAGTLLSL